MMPSNCNVPGPLGSIKKTASVAPLSPRVAAILQNAMLESRFGHFELAHEYRFNFADGVERSGINNNKARQLVAKLRRCFPNRRCYSPACDNCRTVKSQLMTSVSEEFVRDQLGKSDIAVVT